MEAEGRTFDRSTRRAAWRAAGSWALSGRPIYTAKQAVLHALFAGLYRCGFRVEQQTPLQRRYFEERWTAEREARASYERLEPAAKLALPSQLEAKYAQRLVLGTVTVYDAIARLAFIIDPLDPYLGAVSQLHHQLQLAMMMEEDGLDERFILLALVHDLGKLLIDVADEHPMNVEAGGKKTPLAGEPGCGLLNCTFRWDHGDFAYLRLKAHLPSELAWVIRHHSIDVDACSPYMNARDRQLTETLLLPLIEYDMRKDLYALPRKRLEDYRPLLERAFPDPIPI